MSPLAPARGQEPVPPFWGTGREICFEAGEARRGGAGGSRAVFLKSAGARRMLHQGRTPVLLRRAGARAASGRAAGRCPRGRPACGPRCSSARSPSVTQPGPALPGWLFLFCLHLVSLARPEPTSAFPHLLGSGKSLVSSGPPGGARRRKGGQGSDRRAPANFPSATCYDSAAEKTTPQHHLAV